MEKRVINPWQWQTQSGYQQAVEVKQASATLYCAGQAAIDAEGNPSSGDVRVQLQQVLGNVIIAYVDVRRDIEALRIRGENVQVLLRQLLAVKVLSHMPKGGETRYSVPGWLVG